MWHLDKKALKDLVEFMNWTHSHGWLKGSYLKDETHQGCILLSHDRESSQYAQVRVGVNRLNFDLDTHTDYWRKFYRSSSEASFHHYIWGKVSNRCQAQLLPTAMSPQELLIEKTYGRLMLYNLACKTYTAIPTLQQATDELSMKTCKSIPTTTKQVLG